MNPTTHTLATVLALLLHGAAAAGPVATQAIEAAATPDAAASGVAAVAAVAADAANAPLGSPARGLGDAVRAADTAASAPSGSALVLEMLKEADAAAGHEAAPPARRGAAAGAQPPGVAAAAKPAQDNDPFGLRDIGKATVRWAKSVIPWLGNDDEADAGKPVLLHEAEWSATAQGRGGVQAMSPPAGAGTHAPPQAEVVYGHGDAQRAQPAPAEYNLLREVIDALRLVLEHPMTWLVAALIAIGAVAVKKMDRRPTK